MNKKILLITDTLCDANGVSRFIQDIAKVAYKSNKNFLAISSTNKKYCDKLSNIKILKPILDIKMPFYPELSIVVPPIIKLYKQIKSNKPTSIHISTPGTLGLSALLIAKYLKIPIYSTYHTDFASYVYSNTNSKILKRVVRFYEQIFYKATKGVFIRSNIYHSLIEDKFKISKEKIFTIPAGIDIDRFDINNRDSNYFEQYGISKDAIKVLYVGRVTKEKNIEFLLNMWIKNYKKYVNTWLILVGSGSFLNKKDEYEKYNIKFLGHKDKDELATIYPSSDIFIFPSNTDTLGQVVIEAMANGLPLLVSNQGGPQSLIDQDKVNGYIIEANLITNWHIILKRLIKDKNLRDKLSKNSKELSKKYSIKTSFNTFWSYMD